MGDVAVVVLVLGVAGITAALAVGMVAVANAPQRIIARNTVEMMAEAAEEAEGVDWTPDAEK